MESIISRRRRRLHRRVAAVLEKRASTTPRRLDSSHITSGSAAITIMLTNTRVWRDEAVRLRAWDDASQHYENALASLEDGATKRAPLKFSSVSPQWRGDESRSGGSPIR